MPQIGDIAKLRDIRRDKVYAPGDGHERYIWIACEVCGKERWVYYNKGKPKNTMCLKCSRKLHVNRVYPTGADTSNWKGGQTYVYPRPGGSKRALVKCEICGEERWSYLLHGKPRHSMCLSCSRKLTGDKTSMWKGGQWSSGKGYLYIKLAPDDFYASMMNKAGYVARDRLTMAKSLGRCLNKWEIVHHKDGIKDHDDIGNLELQDKSSHLTMHNTGYKAGYRKGLKDGRTKQIQDLKEEIEKLRDLLGKNG